MRASDNDRDRAADVLKAALAEGRLDYEEHSERLNRVMNSRTYGELVHVTSDLPGGLGNHPAPVANTWQPQPGYVRREQPEPLAIASLVLGILGFLTAGLTTIPAIVTGHLALARVKRARTDGHGMAMAGVVMGYLQVAIGIVLVLLVLGIFAMSGFGGGGDFGPPDID
jgi:hypothetical protein